MKLHDIPWTGEQITKPGCYSRVPLTSYHHPEICDGPSISSTGLRAIYSEKGSPRHFYANWAGNPKRIIKPEPRHFIVGRALHHLTLGMPYFAKLFCVQPSEWPDHNGVLKKWNNNRTVCRQWNREKIAEGRIPLAAGEVDMIREMAISLGNHPLVREGALQGLVERSYFWKDKETGIWLKWRPDSTPTDSADFADIKTTIQIYYAALVRVIEDYGYYRQAALGQQACREVLDMDMNSFTLIFVEKSAPWTTRDVRCKDEALTLGARENRAATRLFAKCVRDDHWPGPGEGNEGNEVINLSKTAIERRTERLKYEGLPDGQD